MKKTTRLVALIACILVLVLACSLIIACQPTECADGKHTDSNHDGVCEVCGKKDLAVTHEWDAATGKCSVCGIACTHGAWTNGTCDVCKMPCAHATWTLGAEKSTCTVCGTECTHEHWTNGVCDLCKYACEHDWNSNLGICKICELKCVHKFDEDGKCTVCELNDPNYSDKHYPHTFVNGVCSEPTCGWECVHKDNIDYFHDSVCTLCKFECTNHDWNAEDGTCNVCGKEHEHSKDDFTTKGKDTSVCDVCGWTCPHDFNAKSECGICGYVCVDHEYDAEAKTGKCTVCGVMHKHAAADWTVGYESSTCTVCHYVCEHAAWTDGKCDLCEYACDHHEGYKFGVCSHCGIRMPDNFEHTHSYELVATMCSICGQRNPNHTVSYTYHSSTSELPTMWNVLNYQANQSTLILDYATDEFFTFDYNNTENLAASTGYVMKTSMLAKDPEDVTANYKADWAKWGIVADGDGNAKSRIWKLTLRSDLKFDNGDAITTQDFIDSLQRLIAPAAANYRADGLWSGDMVVHNAKNYFYQGKTMWNTARDVFDTYSESNDSRLVFTLGNTKEVQALTGDSSASVVKMRTLFGFPESYGKANVVAYLIGSGYVEGTPADFLALEGKTLAEIKADPALKAAWEQIIEFWQTEPNEELDFFISQFTWPAVNIDSVGLQKISDTEMYVVLDKELEGFYLKYSLGSLPLVHVATYDRCAKTENGIYSNSYATSADTFVGYGPYKLVAFVADSIALFERNQYWWGYTSGTFSDHTKYYQTEEVSIKQIVDEATRREMFLKGELDGYGLLEADMKDYQSSKYTYYTDGDSTWFVALNPDMAGLESAQKTATPLTAGNEVNKTILTIKEFRQALSFSIDRDAFNLALSPTSSVAKALYSNMIIYDPDLGSTYRSTDAAKNAILAFWGLSDWESMTDEDGEPMFEDIDEAIDFISGYNLEAAKKLFNEAYDKAVADGLISDAAIKSGKWEIQIMIGQPGTGSSTYYNKGYDHLKQIWTAAVEGTKLAGHLTFKQSQPLGSTNFSDYLKNNTVDVLFGVGWTGSALNPYGLIEAYVAPRYQYDPGWNTDATDLVIELELEEGQAKLWKASVKKWQEALGGDEITITQVELKDGKYEAVMSEGKAVTKTFVAGVSTKSEMRVAILAKIEQAVLEQYDMIPVSTDASASLKGYRIVYGTEEYIYGVGRGGIKYMTYDAERGTDADFAAFVAQNNGNLESIYKASASVED